MNIRERYPAKAVGANSTTTILGQSIGGFICVTAGTITVKNSRGTTVLDTMPVSAGVFYPLPIYVGSDPTGQFITAGGASGSLLG